MAEAERSHAANARLERMLGFVGQDPDNPRLLADAAEAAYQANELDRAAELLEHAAGIASLDPATNNLCGLIALGRHRYDEAAQAFSRSLAEQPKDPGLRFNLAWAYAMAKRYEEALELLDGEVMAASAHAPRLKIQMLHHLERYEEALALGADLLVDHAGDQALMGSLSTLALDAEDEALARSYAERAGHSGEGLAALGVLALGDEEVERAEKLFDQAIVSQPRNARAWMGKGLALLSKNDPAGGSKALDHGAELFGDHIGSWIASGWARFAMGNAIGARASFERARAIDPNFGETHGALAVLDIVEGRVEAGRRGAEVALRLDRDAFGGQLARVLLLQQTGDGRAAKRLREKALSMPIGSNGRTIGQALAAFALRRG